MTEELIKPLHTIVIDGVAFAIRADQSTGRLKAFEILSEGNERGATRSYGYRSLKEVFDALFVRQLQD